MKDTLPKNSLAQNFHFYYDYPRTISISNACTCLSSEAYESTTQRYIAQRSEFSKEAEIKLETKTFAQKLLFVGYNRTTASSLAIKSYDKKVFFYVHICENRILTQNNALVC